MTMGARHTCTCTCMCWQSTGLVTQWSRVQIPSEAAQCFFHCLSSDLPYLVLPSFAYTCTRFDRVVILCSTYHHCTRTFFSVCVCPLQSTVTCTCKTMCWTHPTLLTLFSGTKWPSHSASKLLMVSMLCVADSVFQYFFSIYQECATSTGRHHTTPSSTETSTPSVVCPA